MVRNRKRKGVRNYEELLKGDILGYRISWHNEFDCRDNYGSPMVLFRLAMVVCNLRISRGVFLN